MILTTSLSGFSRLIVGCTQPVLIAWNKNHKNEEQSLWGAHPSVNFFLGLVFTGYTEIVLQYNVQ